MLLPDINVWLALTFQSHSHHPAAKAWFDGLSDELCFFCRLTQQGFLRLATNQKAFPRDALLLFEAWQKYDTYLTDPRISFADEPTAIEDQWRILTQSHSYSHHIWNDAYLAAFAMSASLKLVTFDRGFRSFPNVPCTFLPLR
jgi:uncharacterized protein